MGDYISKKALLEKLKYMGDYNIDMDYVTAEDIMSIPSADVRENIHGEWIKNFLGIDICSKCGEPMRDRRVNHINFCNCCGADMRGE